MEGQTFLFWRWHSDDGTWRAVRASLDQYKELAHVATIDPTISLVDPRLREQRRA